MLQQELRNSKLRARNIEESYRKVKRDLELAMQDKQALLRENQELTSLLEQRDMETIKWQTTL